MARTPERLDEVADGGQGTLADEAFATHDEAIRTGPPRPGERLPTEDLAEVLEMIAMPIRAALGRLDAAGIVENIPDLGARVTKLSIEDLREVYELRLALEPLTIRRAAEQFTDEDAATATKRLSELNALPDDNSTAAWAAHTAFHFALYDAAGANWLLRLIRPLWESSERYRRAAPVSHKLAMRRREHELILQACIEHDADRAAAAIRDHLAISANVVSKAVGGQDLFVFTAP